MTRARASMRALLLALAVQGALLQLAAQTPAQTPAFSSRVEAVRVDVLVTDNGRPVTGLTTSNFEITDNGVKQTIDLVLFEKMPLNVVLALDMSKSVSGERLEHLRTAAAAILGGLKPDDKAGLVTFSEHVVRQSGLTNNLATLRTALDNVVADGATSLIDGAYGGMMVGESDVGRSLLVVFSDGLDTTSWLQADEVLDIAKRCDVVVYGVATGGARDSKFLRDLSSFTGGRLFEVESTKNLDQLFLSILEEFRHRYLITYSPRNVQRGGWHQLEVKTTRRGAAVKARPGYLGGS